METHEFEVKEGDLTVAGFTKPQTGLLKDTFDRQEEDMLVEACSREIAKIFSQPNKFEKRLAKMERIPIENPATKRLYNNIIYSDDPEYYCAGSGGVGGGKAFWTPYTSSNEETRKKARDEMCDNCKTLTHESQHGIGSNVEFDFFSSLIGIYNRMEHFPPNERFNFEISSYASGAERGCETGYKERYQRKSRNMLCAINERYPEQLRMTLTETGWHAETIGKVLKCACGKEE